MSVLIKGMEMPENCDKCRFQSELRLYCDAMPYNFCGNTDDIERPDWCPLVEVKIPHGRLIDADELANKTFYNPISAPYITYKTFCNAPTVIEAEGEKDGR